MTTKTKAQTLSVQVYVPIQLNNIEIEELAPEAVKDAVAKDLSLFNWEPTWDDIKSAVSGGEAVIYQKDEDCWAAIY